MRFGAITFIWASPFATEELGLVDRVAGLGFEVLEVAVEEAGLLDPEALRDALERTGLGCVVVGFCTADRDLSSDDEEVRRAGVEYAKRCVDLAVTAGAPLVAGPLHQAVGKARFVEREVRSAELERAVAGLAEVADHAGERGVSLAIEPLNRWESDMLNTVEQGLDLCDAVGRQNVGLLLDTFHQNIEEKRIGDAIRAAGGAFAPLPRIRERPRCSRQRPRSVGRGPRGSRRRAVQRGRLARIVLVEDPRPGGRRLDVAPVL